MRIESIAKCATIVFLLIALSAGVMYLWENRKPLLTSFTGAKAVVDVTRIPNPSPASKTQLIQFADSKKMILGVTVTKVDFRMNTRATTFRYLKEKEVEAEWNAFVEKKQTAPLFSDNEANNQRLVNLINGQFSCVKTLDTVTGRLLPTINQYALTTCMVPIPPEYGDFVGFINIFLRIQPSVSEIANLELVAEQVARDIYQRDIVKSTLKFGDPN